MLLRLQIVIKLTLYVFMIVSCDKNDQFYRIEPQEIHAKSHISRPT